MSALTYTPLEHIYGCACRKCSQERRRLTRAARRRSRGTHGDLDERAPRGTPGKLSLVSHPHMGMTPYHDGCGKLRTFPVPDISELLAWRDPERPWLLQIWERLPTKAPGPHLVRPYCCYINTIILYAQPYQLLPPKRYLSWGEIGPDGKYRRLERPVIRKDSTGSFAEYDRLEHRLEWNTLLGLEGDTFEYSGGGVRWVRPHWWMLSRARRVKPGDRLSNGRAL